MAIKRIPLINGAGMPASDIMDVLREAHARLRDMAARLRELEELMAADSSRALLDEYDRLSDDFRRLGGYDMDRERSRVAAGLDIDRKSVV